MSLASVLWHRQHIIKKENIDLIMIWALVIFTCFPWIYIFFLFQQNQLFWKMKIRRRREFAKSNKLLVLPLSLFCQGGVISLRCCWVNSHSCRVQSLSLSPHSSSSSLSPCFLFCLFLWLCLYCFVSLFCLSFPCLCLSVCLSVCLSLSLSISASLCFCLSLSLFLSLSFSLSLDLYYSLFLILLVLFFFSFFSFFLCLFSLSFFTPF